ncbi:MAG: hypothetical protein HUK08_09035, partial [Bacteroidaceae bacterium]|nr:hypothetical protein [Bacteroidaceae bacterium]
MNKLIMYLAFCLAVVGCAMADRQCEEVMSEADKVMEANPDSAAVSIRLLDGISSRVSSLPTRQQMRYHLLYAKAMNKGFVDFTSDSIMKQVCEYYDSHGTDYEKMMANYLLGCVYRDLGESPRAIYHYERAAGYPGDDRETYLLKGRIYGQEAELLHRLALVEQECRALDMTAKYDMLAGDSISATIAISQKARAYSLIDKHDSTIYYNNVAVERFKEMGCEQYAARDCPYSIKSYIALGQYQSAKECIDFYEEKSGFFHNDTAIAGHETYYYTKGLYYAHTNRYDSAQLLFRRCLAFPDEPKMRLNAYRGFSVMYDKMGVADSTAKYALLTYKLNDSIYLIDAAEAVLRQQASYNYERYQEEARKKADSIIALQWWLMGAAAVIVCIAGGAVYVYRKVRRANQWKLLQVQERYETEKTLLQTEMEELNALLEEKESLLENKDLIFERKRKELDDEIEQKEESISELQNRVAQYEKKLKIRSNAEIDDEIQGSAVREKFMAYTTDVRKHPTERQWRELMDMARTHLPQMLVLLNKYNISEREMRVCILTRLRFKPGEIATIMDCRFPEVSLTRS